MSEHHYYKHFKVAMIVIGAGSFLTLSFILVHALERKTSLPEKVEQVKQGIARLSSSQLDATKPTMLLQQAKAAFDKQDMGAAEQYVDEALTVLNLSPVTDSNPAKDQEKHVETPSAKDDDAKSR